MNDFAFTLMCIILIIGFYVNDHKLVVTKDATGSSVYSIEEKNKEK